MKTLAFLLALVLYDGAGRGMAQDDASATQRPFYVIGHMANSIATMDSFIRQGANAVELDLTFESNGAAWWVFHGVPCDYFRLCHESTQFIDYLRAASSRNLTLLFLDLKCSKLEDEAKRFGGIDVARKLIGHFWEKGAMDVNVVLSIPYVADGVLFEAFMKEMRAANESWMNRVSFDVSENPDFYEVVKMYRRLNITSAWQGDGVTNWFEPFRSFSRVRNAIEIRDRGDNVIKKVYRWTVDWKSHIRQLIYMGIDGIITNNPDRCSQVVREVKEVRLARQKDSVNDLFQP
ncbi:sphingomyelin phosphodiesterase D SpaSicTox-betaIF1-like [Tropilaelaps mercedesae]|uniref:Sphingomyelin phosphodiesterase D SpaSicTox-betaIF1-like n=1 Tax=Tropilaelaps mercedesae TaxID=418985 RepID=A0A1V9XP71_9ACAR|nr:sphingomyelin phosphodiesterase D SpaSicTox-betaIF1-like [Tropilaelaps mercedesae]